MESDDREKVEIYVSCKQLNTSSQCDTIVRCQLQEQGNWKLIGQTEIIEDNSDPTFSIPFTLDFIFEVQQPILFEVINVNNKSSPQVLGTVQSTVGSLMGARKQTSTFDLKLKDTKVGQLVTQGEKAGKGSGTIAWRWRGFNLLNTDSGRGLSDPFLRFLKIRKSGDVLKIHETEAVSDNLNPTWNPFEIAIDRIGYDPNRPFKIECWDWEKAGKYQLIGECQATLASIKSGTTEFELRHSSAPGCTGVLKVEVLSKETKSASQGEPTFIDYIRGGVQLNAVVAIDFTGSNGEPQYSYSLHYMNPKGDLNDYQKAITSVCQIVLSYDFDQLIPVYGFGGKPHYPTMDSNHVSHCFPCTGTSEQHEVQGMQGIMDVYSYALKNVEFSGPTYFAPLLKEAIKVGQYHKDKDDDIYSIFLILTDGAIHDMDPTIDAVVACSELPISIIVVGIGKADFSNMVTLDGDQGLTDSHGKKASRDVVQFVPFNDLNGDMNALAQRVLAEVPDQLVQYMKIAGKKPKPPQTV